MTSQTAPNAANAVDSLSFEQALAELEAIVQRLERGDVPLEQSIAIYGRGEALKARCDQLLKQAEVKIEQIALNSDGSVQGTVPFQAG